MRRQSCLARPPSLPHFRLNYVREVVCVCVWLVLSYRPSECDLDRCTWLVKAQTIIEMKSKRKAAHIAVAVAAVVAVVGKHIKVLKLLLSEIMFY